MFYSTQNAGIQPAIILKDFPQIKKKEIEVIFFPEICSPDVAIQNIAKFAGPIDVICWYEGKNGLPAEGASFMESRILIPLLSQKTDVRISLYSLKAWKFTAWNLKASLESKIPKSQSVINRINQTAIEWIDSADFFTYCAHVKEGPLYQLVKDNLPKKAWLLNLSKKYPSNGLSIQDLFEQDTYLLDCFKDMPAARAYACMQYLEGFYLIRELVAKGIQDCKTEIQIGFLLPNDEGKYYQNDFEEFVIQMLELEFEEALANINVKIIFSFFQYGNRVELRPYIINNQVKPTINQTRYEIHNLWPTLPQTPNSVNRKQRRKKG